MLISFSVSNYKSFKDKATLSLEKVPKQKDLSYSLIKRKYGKEKKEILSTSVIYGLNASGKSNIISALNTLVRIINRSHVRNSNSFIGDPASSSLELIPFQFLDEIKPTVFCLEYATETHCYVYELSVELGSFNDEKFERFINSESLRVDGSLLFQREQNEVDFSLSEKDGARNELVKELARKSLKDDELFLTNGFKNIVNKELADDFLLNIRKRLHVICHADLYKASPIAPKAEESVFDYDGLSEIIRIFGLKNDLKYYSPAGEDTGTLYSCANGKPVLPVEQFESYGTVRFLRMYPVILDVLKNGGELIADEFDASLHPNVVFSLISIFHNDEVNTKGAQLVFNTQNPLFMTKTAFRRDEIKFVEKNREDGASTIYCLADYGTSGSKGVRKGEDYMHNYLRSKYGAIEDIDLIKLFK